MDTRPLTDPLDRRGARRFARQLRSRGRVGGARTPGGSLIARIGILIGVVVSALAFAFVMQLVRAPLPSDRGVDVVALAITFAGIVVAGAMVLWIVEAVSGRRRPERWFRLHNFAASNGFVYTPVANNLRRPGIIFEAGDNRQATDILSGGQSHPIEFGNYRYTLGAGKDRRTYRWGYVAIRLSVPLPHIVLEGQGKRMPSGSHLPASFRRDQRLRLEGDFDRFFAMYVPRGYERDALYLFTPDVMARLIDNATGMDVEIIDDWLFLYDTHDIVTLDPDRWAKVAETVEALEAKLGQWKRWRDERLSEGAEGGAGLPASRGAAGEPASRGAAVGPVSRGAAVGPASRGAAGEPASRGAAGEPAAAGQAGHAVRPSGFGVGEPPQVGVGKGGRRLARGSSWLAVAVGVGLAAIWGLSLLLR